MLELILALALGAAADEAAKSELVELATKIVDAQSYTFTYAGTSTSTNANGKESAPEPAPGGAKDPSKPVHGGARRDVWTVQYERKQPRHFTKGHADFYRSEQRCVAIGRNDEWFLLELPTHGANDRPANGEKMHAMTRLALEADRIPMPNWALAKLATRLAEVTREEKEGKRLFSATFTKEAVREMMGGGKPATKPAGGEGGADAAEATAGATEWSGTLHAVATKEGLDQVELQLVAKSAATTRTIVRKYELSAVNATRVAVPEPAAKLLDKGE